MSGQREASGTDGAGDTFDVKVAKANTKRLELVKDVARGTTAAAVVRKAGFELEPGIQIMIGGRAVQPSYELKPTD